MSSPQNTPTTSTDSNTASSSDALILQTLHAQLERMRAMLYKYSELFYQLIIVGIIVLILMTVASFTETFRATVLLMPFFTIYLGVQSAYFLTYVVFARIYATGIEQRINRLLKDEVLIAHKQESAYLFPLDSAQFAGVPLRLRQTFIGFITIHFWITGAVVITLSSFRAWQLLPVIQQEFPPVALYFPALILWSLLHLAYLVWYFGTRYYERRIMSIVKESYRTDYNAA